MKNEIIDITIKVIRDEKNQVFIVRAVDSRHTLKSTENCLKLNTPHGIKCFQKILSVKFL